MEELDAFLSVLICLSELRALPAAPVPELATPEFRAIPGQRQLVFPLPFLQGQAVRGEMRGRRATEDAGATGAAGWSAPPALEAGAAAVSEAGKVNPAITQPCLAGVALDNAVTGKVLFPSPLTLPRF